MKVSYNWLQDYFAESLPSVSELEQVFMLQALEVDGIEEVNGDSVIDLDVLPNRAHDCLGHRGVAKELSVLLDRKMKKDELGGSTSKLTELSSRSTKLSVEVQDQEWCPRYTGALIKGVKVGESPKWLREKLEAIGQKSINNVVDITNYVMFDLGQPTHIFDADKLTDNSGIKIAVRKAKRGEEITVLGGDKYELDDSVAVITDANNDTPIAIAGIKGGEVAEVDEDTVNIVVESAKFHPTKTRKASAKIKLRTDAVQRFENEIPIELPAYGVLEVARLIQEVAGGEVEGFVDSWQGESQEHKVSITIAGLNNFLGSDITMEQAVDIINRFGWEHEVSGETLIVTPPFERLDVRIAEDLYEEIGRVYGFENIKGKMLPSPAPEKFINKEWAYSELVRKVMLEEGVTETMTYTLTDKGDIKLASILSADKDHIRSNLRVGLSDALERAVKNAPLLGEYNMVKIFEIGRVFPKGGEHTSMAIGVKALTKKKAEQREQEALEIVRKALEQELGAKLADVTINNGILEFNLSDTIANLPTPSEYPKLPLIGKGVKYTPISPFPFVTRDIAVWVPENAQENEITDVIYKYGGELVQRVDKFDEFKTDGRVSLAYHIVFQSQNKTLTDDEVGQVMQKIEGELNSKENFEVR